MLDLNLAIDRLAADRLNCCVVTHGGDGVDHHKLVVVADNG